MFYAEKLAKTPLTLSLWTINLWRGLENIDADCTYLPRIFCAYHRILHAYTRMPANLRLALFVALRGILPLYYFGGVGWESLLLLTHCIPMNTCSHASPT